MKKLLLLIASVALVGTAYAGGEMKSVCHDKLDKAGKPVKDKEGNSIQVCKTIIVHKKLDDTTPVPVKK